MAAHKRRASNSEGRNKLSVQRRKFNASPESGSSQQLYEINDILDETKTRYLLDWKDDPVTGESFQPTWEPKSYANEEAVADWERQKKAKAEKTWHRKPAAGHIGADKGEIFKNINVSGPRGRRHHLRVESSSTVYSQYSTPDKPTGRARVFLERAQLGQHKTSDGPPVKGSGNKQLLERASLPPSKRIGPLASGTNNRDQSSSAPWRGEINDSRETDRAEQFPKCYCVAVEVPGNTGIDKSQYVDFSNIRLLEEPPNSQKSHPNCTLSTFSRPLSSVPSDVGPRPASPAKLGREAVVPDSQPARNKSTNHADSNEAIAAQISLEYQNTRSLGDERPVHASLDTLSFIPSSHPNIQQRSDLQLGHRVLPENSSSNQQIYRSPSSSYARRRSTTASPVHEEADARGSPAGEVNTPATTESQHSPAGQTAGTHINSHDGQASILDQLSSLQSSEDS